MAKGRRKSKKPGRRAKSDDGRKADQKRAGEVENKADKAKEKKPKSAARNLVETIAVVAVLVLGIRFLLLEAFKIPSGSMEPALIGHPYHGDRVLAWKPSVRWTSPERWSVNVFVKHPDEREILWGDGGDKNYIKRLIGLPGERVLIAGGNIFIEARGAAEARIARKPRSIQERVWHAVYEGTDLKESWELGPGFPVITRPPTLGSEVEGTAWARFTRNHYEDDAGLVTNLYVKRLRVRVRCSHRGCGAEFKASIRTGRTRFPCPACGGELDILRDNVFTDAGVRFRYPRTHDEETPVGDLRVSFDVVPERAGGFVLAELTCDRERYRARVPLGGGEVRVRGPHGVEAQAQVPAFTPNETKRISFAHVDQTLVLAIDGEEIIRQEYDLSWTACAGTPGTNGVGIGIEGASVLFANVRIERDLHYLSRGSGSIVEFYSGGRGRDQWRDSPTAGVPGMPPYIGSAPAVRTRERLAGDEYFFMGDNSPSSYDSRMWGTVRAKDMVGRAFFAFWPPHQMKWMP